MSHGESFIILMTNCFSGNGLYILDEPEAALSPIKQMAMLTVIEELPIQIVSTGLRYILIPIKNIDMVNAIKPNFEKMPKISSKYNTIGYPKIFPAMLKMY